MGRAAVLQGVRQMRFEALLDRRERGELNQECWGSRSGHFAAGAAGGAMKGGQRGSTGGSASHRAGGRRGKRSCACWGFVMLGLCAERYAGFTVKHFHEEMTKGHNYKLGHRVTRLSLQAAGVVRPG